MFYEDEYQHYLATTGRVTSTRQVHRYTVNHFTAHLQHCGVTDVRQVTPHHVVAYCRWMQERGFVPGSVSGEFGRLRIYFEYLRREKIIFTTPLPDTKLPRPVPRPPQVLTAEQMREILDSLATATSEAIRGKAILELAYSSALRPREVRALKICDVDFRKGLLFIEQSKNRKDRIVPAGTVALSWVKQYLSTVRPRVVHGQTHPLLFVGHVTGNPLSREGLIWAVRETYRNSGLESIPLRALRACAATNLLDAGMGLAHISRFLGHVDVKTTQSYLGIRERELAAVLARAHERIRARYKGETL